MMKEEEASKFVKVPRALQDLGNGSQAEVAGA